MWTLLNFVGITIETMAAVISQVPRVRAIEVSYWPYNTSLGIDQVSTWPGDFIGSF